MSEDLGLLDVSHLKRNERLLLHLQVIAFELSPEPERTSIALTLTEIVSEWTTSIMQDVLRQRAREAGEPC